LEEERLKKEEESTIPAPAVSEESKKLKYERKRIKREEKK